MSSVIQYPPLFTITPLDQSGVVAITTGECLVTAFVAVLIRAYMLVRTRGLKFNWDDTVIVVSLILALIQTSLVQREATIGLGRTIRAISTSRAETIQEYIFADQIFFILSLWTSKLSSILFLMRLTPRKSDHRLAHGVIGLLAVTGVAAVLIVSLVCDLSHPWQFFQGATITCTSPVSKETPTTTMASY